MQYSTGVYRFQVLLLDWSYLGLCVWDLWHVGLLVPSSILC